MIAPHESSSPNPPGVQTVRFKIERRDAPDAQPYWEQFNVVARPGANVISCLQQIALKPVTIEGKQVTPVVWDCNCLEEVCGACTMVINGHARQSCSTLLHELMRDGFGSAEKPVVLQPMSKFPIVRDLWVNRARMFENLKKIKGWVPIDGTHALGAGPTESPDKQELRYGLSRCMTCGCCLEACPQFTLDNDFVGAQTIAQALYFNMHETGAKLKDDRLEAMEAPGGVADCGNAQNCVKVCPKEVPLLEGIAAIGRQTTVHAIRTFFSGK